MLPSRWNSSPANVSTCGGRSTRSEFRSGLVDLAECVVGHFGGGHIRAGPGQRFVAPDAERLAQMRYRTAQLGERGAGDGPEGEAGRGGRGLVAPEAVEKCGEY